VRVRRRVRQNDRVDGWRDTVRRAGATAVDAAIDGAGADLRDRWAEPHRHYHTPAHLRAVLATVDEAIDHADDADAVRLAAWFHDAVYDPHATGAENEAASAGLAVAVLSVLGLPAGRVEEVRRLVLVTAAHAPEPGDRDGELLCDADLAVLARPAADYDAYAAAVRREYAHVDDAAFRAGRAAVLRRLLDLPALYRVPALAARWEQPARANLARELAALTAP
jgi:predicted metal-dependent HD superfamily phosphohydrolase